MPTHLVHVKGPEGEGVQTEYHLREGIELTIPNGTIYTALVAHEDNSGLYLSIPFLNTEPLILYPVGPEPKSFTTYDKNPVRKRKIRIPRNGKPCYGTIFISDTNQLHYAYEPAQKT